MTTDGTNTSWATNPLGTVTSVAATVPSFLSISGSPITTSGTLAFGLSGTALPTTSGGTGLTSFTANGIVYASSTSALATGSALQFDGTNLGLGIAPASWDSAFVALDGGASTPSNGNGTLFFQKNGGYTTALGSNVYYNAGWKYRTTAASDRYEINNNSFAWSFSAHAVKTQPIRHSRKRHYVYSSNDLEFGWQFFSWLYWLNW